MHLRLPQNAETIQLTARNSFHNAVLLLDRGEPGRGEELLRQTITEAERGNDRIALVQALVCLGDLLCSTGRQLEGRPFLEKALVEDAGEDDLLSYELERARQLTSE